MVEVHKSPTAKFRMSVATLLCCVLLGALAAYLWNYDYQLKVPGGKSASSLLRPILRVGDGAEFQSAPGICACFSLVNGSAAKLRLVDTHKLQPLYDVKLLHRTPDGALLPAPMTASHIEGSRKAAQEAIGFDRKRDSVVELVPGAALTRVIPLSVLFELQRAGRYDLIVTYQPGALVQPQDEPLSDLQVCEEPRMCAISFDLPLAKAARPEPDRPVKPQRSSPAEAPEKGQ